MSMFGVIAIYLLPGSVLAAHQGIAHWEGASVPKFVAFGWSMPYWLFYGLVVLFGPVIFLAILIQHFARW